jgi:L-lactate dehydrogenase
MKSNTANPPFSGLVEPLSGQAGQALSNTQSRDLSTPRFGAPGKVDRVAIIGAGAVGATTAYALLISGTPAEIVLINRDRKLAQGQVDDLRDAALFSHTTRIVAGDFSDCSSADVIIITAGVHQQADTASRLDDLKESANILRGIVSQIMRSDPQGVLLIASNPVDVLTYGAWRWSGLPANRVIGSGTSLDTSRFRRRLGERFGVAPDNVHAYIIGEHGDTQVPVISSAHIGGILLEDFCREVGLPYEACALRAIAADTRTAGLQILQAKGATYYGIGAALTRIVNAILRDEHAVLTVSSLAPESLKLGEVSLSLPTVINRGGVARVLSIPLNEEEQQAVRSSAEVLKQYDALLNGLPGSVD